MRLEMFNRSPVVAQTSRSRPGITEKQRREFYEKHRLKELELRQQMNPCCSDTRYEVAEAVSSESDILSDVNDRYVSRF